MAIPVPKPDEQTPESALLLGKTHTFSRDPRTLSGPTRLRSYRIIREIGRGGMGVVYEAEDDVLKRRVALKVLALERAQDSQARARFLREAQAAAKLDHDNVVPIFDVGEEAGVPFLVMPLLCGESLQARLERGGPLQPDEVIRLGRDLAAGLAAAHARKLVHRDVKPANVWLTETGKARILDFGLARLDDATDGIEKLTASGAILGTPAYLSPEQIDGLPIDHRADLFSLGATLYQCATGKRPFVGPTLSAILRSVTGHHPLPPQQVNPAIPAALSDLIVQMLAKDPSARPQSAQGVADRLVIQGDKETARQGDRKTRISRLALLIASTAAVLLAVGIWFITYSAKSGEGSSPSPDNVPALKPNDASVRFHGRLDVLIERDKHLLRLNESGALPLRKTDKFRIEGRIEPPAYLYVLWVDPNHDVTPVYPWDPKVGWGSRPTREEPVGGVSLPSNAGNRYTAPDARPGVATMVLFARPTALDVPDEVVRSWFEGLDDLPLPAGGEQAAVWFDDYVEVRDPDRPRTFGEVGADDPFARWQGQLQKVLRGKAVFQTAVSFARTGRR